MTAKVEGAGSSPLGQRATEVLVGAATQLGRMVGRVRIVGERAAQQIGLTDKPGESTTQAIDAPSGTSTGSPTPTPATPTDNAVKRGPAKKVRTDKAATKSTAREAAAQKVTKKAPVNKAPAQKVTKKAPANKKPANKAPAKKAVKKPPAQKASARGRPARQPPKKAVVNEPTKMATKKSTGKGRRRSVS